MNTVKEPITVDRTQLIQGVTDALEGKIPAENLAKITNGLAAQEGTIFGTLCLTGLLFYMRVWIGLKGETNNCFIGNSGGIGLPGGGCGLGDLYSNNFPLLFSTTTQFSVVVAGVYTAVIFLNSSSEVLGHFEAGALGPPGVYGGSGSWGHGGAAEDLDQGES